MNPTIETNSPRSTDKLARSSTCRADGPAPNVFEIEVISRKAT
jgi:hypothetical protein